MIKDEHKIYEELNRSLKEGNVCALVTVVKSSDSSPGKIGFKMLVYPDGRTLGTVGGGAVESRAIKESINCLEHNCAKYFEFELNDLGMLCGGSMAFFIEPIGYVDKMYIFGGGHIGQAVSKIAFECGFKVTIIDDRERFLTREMFNNQIDLVQEDMIKTATNLEVHPDRTYVVIATYSHNFDQSVLEVFLKKPSFPKYIGVIASRRKAQEIKDNLSLLGISEPLFSQVKMPIGLPIGAKTPMEIAVSIMAEIIKTKRS